MTNTYNKYKTSNKCKLYIKLKFMYLVMSKPTLKKSLNCC